jgi:hypothetical protein
MPLLDLSVDLRPVANQQDLSPLTAWFEFSEQLIDEWKWQAERQRIVNAMPPYPSLPPDIRQKIHESLTADMLKAAGIREKLDGDFQTLSDRMNPEGKWKAQAKLVANRDQIVFTVSVGRDLHRLYEARKMLTQKRIRTP